jgi:hypothetical protein
VPDPRHDQRDDHDQRQAARRDQLARENPVAGDQHRAGDPGPGRARVQLLLLVPVQLDGQDPTCWNQLSQSSM